MSHAETPPVVDKIADLVGWDREFTPKKRWSDVERELGTALPTDYKELVTRFPGDIFRRIDIDSPVVGEHAWLRFKSNSTTSSTASTRNRVACCRSDPAARAERSAGSPTPATPAAGGSPTTIRARTNGASTSVLRGHPAGSAPARDVSDWGQGLGSTRGGQPRSRGCPRSRGRRDRVGKPLYRAQCARTLANGVR